MNCDDALEHDKHAAARLAGREQALAVGVALHIAEAAQAFDLVGFEIREGLRNAGAHIRTEIDLCFNHDLSNFLRMILSENRTMRYSGGRTKKRRVPRMSSQKPCGVRTSRITMLSQCAQRNMAPIAPP